VLDRASYRFQQFISDIAGQDVVAHGGQPTRAIIAVRDWLAGWLPEQAQRLPAASPSPTASTRSSATCHVSAQRCTENPPT
jgi:hypothetical protein